MFVYWIIGAFFEDVETLTLAVGIVRSFESIGACLAFGIGAAKISPMVNLSVAFAVFAVAIPSTVWATFLVPERPEELKLADGSSVDDELSDRVDETVVVGKTADDSRP